MELVQPDLHLGPKRHVAETIQRGPTLVQLIMLGFDLLQRRDTALAFGRLRLELVIVLYIPLQRGGLERTFLQQVVRDELAHLTERFESKGLYEKPVERLGKET